MRAARKALLSLALAGAMCAGGAIAANAGTSYVGYSVAVPAGNGAGDSAAQTKANSNATGYVKVSGLGCTNKPVDMAMKQVSGGVLGDWVHISSANNVAKGLNNEIDSGKTVKLHISSLWTTPVVCEVSGTWKSN